jgi:hypothetical protein
MERRLKLSQCSDQPNKQVRLQITTQPRRPGSRDAYKFWILAFARMTKKWTREPAYAYFSAYEASPAYAAAPTRFAGVWGRGMRRRFSMVKLTAPKSRSTRAEIR